MENVSVQSVAMFVCGSCTQIHVCIKSRNVRIISGKFDISNGKKMENCHAIHINKEHSNKFKYVSFQQCFAHLFFREQC